jgi:bifunctional NMN adenylyltransferase/nudix hydrolase
VVSVVIGRFQVPSPTIAHQALLRHARLRGDRLLVLVGSSGQAPTRSNPLGFEQRAIALSAFFDRDETMRAFGHFIILPLVDMPGRDADWVKQVDSTIRSVAGYAETAKIYYGDDGCGPTYAENGGAFEVVHVGSDMLGVNLEALKYRATEERKGINPATRFATIDEAFAGGMIYATNQRPLNPFPTVDIAVMRDDMGEVLLGQKAHETEKWRFPGGFVDVADLTLEAAAKRELREECGINLEVGALKYVTSLRVGDERFKNTPEKIMTTMFAAKHMWGDAHPGDDLARVRWCLVNEARSIIHPTHAPLFDALLAWRAQQ